MKPIDMNAPAELVDHDVELIEVAECGRCNKVIRLRDDGTWVHALVDLFPVPRLIEAELPPEPGLGAVVLGKTGRAFQLSVSMDRPMGPRWYPAVPYSSAFQSYGYAWPELLAEQAPLWLVQDTRPEAVQV